MADEWPNGRSREALVNGRIGGTPAQSSSRTLPQTSLPSQHGNRVRAQTRPRLLTTMVAKQRLRLRNQGCMPGTLRAKSNRPRR